MKVINMQRAKKQSKLLLLVFLLPLMVFPAGVGTTYSNEVTATPLFILGGSQGSDIGTQFNEPDAVAVSEDGMIFAGDTLNLRIQVYFPNGTYSHNITGFSDLPNNEVQGIAIDPNGYIRVVELMGRKVKKFHQDGTFISEFGETGTGDGQGDIEAQLKLVPWHRYTRLK